jgi:glycosyltransferase involved in cell wall biosynthesis
MKIVLATGIYPPDIGGPATYVAGLEAELRDRGHDVTVITYARPMSGHDITLSKGVVKVSNAGGTIARWKRYRRALREQASESDVIIAFTSVSVGVPLMWSKLTKPKKILRLGGEFFWERYTDGGGSKGLAAWYRSRFGMWRILNAVFMHGILSSFAHVVYSTQFQRQIHERAYRHLPSLSVIENAVPSGKRAPHTLHSPLRLLFMGRFVRFKHLPVLIEALALLPDAELTITGDGPQKKHLLEQVRRLGLLDRVTFLPPMLGDAKTKLFAEHDLLVIPSVTEISPNVALEAASAGLPVILTAETGLSSALSKGMLVAPMHEKMEVLAAIMKAKSKYADLAKAEPARRSWADVTDEWISLLTRV